MSKQLLHSSHTKLHITQWFTNHSNYHRTLTVLITSQSLANSHSWLYQIDWQVIVCQTTPQSPHTREELLPGRLVQTSFLSHTTLVCLSHYQESTTDCYSNSLTTPYTEED